MMGRWNVSKEYTNHQKHLLETAKELTLVTKKYHALLIESGRHRKQAIRELRKENLTWREISEHLGISQQYLTKLMKNDKQEN